MIKYFCDICGKEIKDKVHTDIESAEATDALGNIVGKFATIRHVCDECVYEDLSCGFKVGDKVITADGRTGYIKDICTCDKCKNRGFYEPTVTMDDGTSEYIEISDKRNGFKSYYSIGAKVFGNLDEESLLKAIQRVDQEIRDLKAKRDILSKQLDVIKDLKEMNEK